MRGCIYRYEIRMQPQACFNFFIGQYQRLYNRALVLRLNMAVLFCRVKLVIDTNFIFEITLSQLIVQPEKTQPPELSFDPFPR